MPPSAILFDFYGTLASGQNLGNVRELELFAQFGYRVDAEQLRRSRAAVQARLDGPEPIDHREFSVSRERYNEFQRRHYAVGLRECGVDPDHPGLFERLCELWDDPSPIYLFDDALPVLAELRGAGYRLGLVSNWSWGLETILQRTGLAPLLECAVVSARAGYRKPHPAIYRLALDALGLEADEVLFVGDNPHADVDGPLAVGMAPVQIDRVGEALRRPGIPCISELAGLFKLLPEGRAASRHFP
ncbi:MAG TPA: HAD family hydrolase [Dehalococcoidia bacterium]|nr:HAD family hydrolase [Dehalococcoidia bacterium]